MAAAKQVTVELENRDPKKHVVKFSTTDDQAPLTSVYLTNEADKKLGNPDGLALTVEGLK